MRGISAIVALELALITGTAQAVELTWGDGSKDVTVTSTSVCTLLVRPSLPGALLPAQWKLVYSGTSSVDSAIVFLSGLGPPDAAPPCQVSGPTTDPERLSNQTTVEFCGPGDGETTDLAAFLVRIDPSLQARIAAVPASSMMSFGGGTIGLDAQVTVNGGSSVPYPPSVVSAIQIPDSAGISRIGLVGVGMDGVQTVVLEGAPHSARRTTVASMDQAADTLALLSQTQTSITAGLQAAPASGQTVALVTTPGGPVGAATLTLPQQWPSTSSGSYTMTPPWPFRAKDFALIYAGGYFHLFYIRHDQTKLDDDTEKDFGHAISHDLQTWVQLDSVLHVQPNTWDDLHVWAPTIVYDNGLYYMFYTGVKHIPYQYTWFQRVGVATSPDLMNWTHYNAPVYFGDIASWTFADSSQQDGCQFRDPFVMPDSSNTSQWLMYHVAVPNAARGQVIVGGANVSRGSVGRWTTLKPFWNTDAAHYLGHIESPMGFVHNRMWYMMYSTDAGHNITFQTANSPTADSSGWVGIYRLWSEGGAGDPSDAWFAPEQLRVAGHDYFAAVRAAGDADDGIIVREMTWGTPPHFSLGMPSVVGVANEEPRREAQLELRGMIGEHGEVGFEVVLPKAMKVRLDVYDVLGRQVAAVQSGSLRAGLTRVPWDGKDHRGSDVPTGIYVASLRTPVGSRSARLAVLR